MRIAIINIIIIIFKLYLYISAKSLNKLFRHFYQDEFDVKLILLHHLYNLYI